MQGDEVSNSTRSALGLFTLSKLNKKKTQNFVGQIQQKHTGAIVRNRVRLVSNGSATQSTSHNCNISRSVCVYKRCVQGLVLPLSFCVVNIYYLFLCVLSLLFVSRCSAILSIYTEATEIPREGARSFHLCNSLIWTALRRRREGQGLCPAVPPCIKTCILLGPLCAVQRWNGEDRNAPKRNDPLKKHWRKKERKKERALCRCATRWNGSEGRKKESVMALPESPLHSGVEEKKEFLGK